MKIYFIAGLLGMAAACASPVASARINLNIGIGLPGLFQAAPPPVVYAPQPVYEPPPVVYGSPYRGRPWHHRGPRWHGHRPMHRH